MRPEGQGRAGFGRHAALALAFWLALTGRGLAQTCEGETVASLYPDATMFDAAIASEANFPPVERRLTGVTIPHHLVAGHLMARGLHATAAHSYDRIILLAPDHFRRVRMAATTRLDFETVLGRVETDRPAAETLLAGGLEEICQLTNEHGVQALLPFIRHYQPGARIVPVIISARSSRADWDRLIAMLLPLIDERTLIVQSTDFSHYLSHATARPMDQQTLNVLSGGTADMLAALRQSENLDSPGALYVHVTLQRQRHGADPVVIASLNQQELTSAPVPETTSYMVILFGAFDPEDVVHEPDATMVYFAGDTLFGRAIAPALSDADAAERAAQAVLARTRGKPLVVNLEGAILPNVPEALPHLTLAMPADLTLDWLGRLGVAGVGLANNHAMDLGQNGIAETKAALESAGIGWFGQGDRLDIGRLSIIGLTDVESNGPPFVDLVDDELLDRLVVEDATRPVAAFIHWGREYVAAPDRRETELAHSMRLRGASLIVGAHPHVASDGLAALAGGEALMAYSLGNFIFDQSSATASGKLLEVRVFDQGTYFARLIDLPNLFDLAKGAPR